MGFASEGEKILDSLTEGLDGFALKILETSLEECPVETGTLRRSVGLEPAHREGDDIVVRFGYGFSEEINPIRKIPASAYAVPVHEKLEAKHAPPTKAKFLEDPVFEYASTFGRYLATYVMVGRLQPPDNLPDLIAGYDNVADLFPTITDA